MSQSIKRKPASEASKYEGEKQHEKSEEYKSFEDFARKVFNIPASEVEELRQKEKRVRKKKRKPKNK